MFLLLLALNCPPSRYTTVTHKIKCPKSSDLGLHHGPSPATRGLPVSDPASQSVEAYSYITSSAIPSFYLIEISPPWVAQKLSLVNKTLRTYALPILYRTQSIDVDKTLYLVENPHLLKLIRSDFLLRHCNAHPNNNQLSIGPPLLFPVNSLAQTTNLHLLYS